MIISKECIEAIEYIAKIYSCFKSTDDVIRGMLRDFARNTDNNVIFDILKTNTCRKIALVYADKLQDYKDKMEDCIDEIRLFANDMEKTIDSLRKDLDDYYRTIIDLINIVTDLSKSLEEDHDQRL